MVATIPLDNQINNCYINAALQCFAHLLNPNTSPLSDAGCVCAGHPCPPSIMQNATDPVISNFYSLMQLMVRPDVSDTEDDARSRINTMIDNMCNAFTKSEKDSKGSFQDAASFMAHIVDKLGEEKGYGNSPTAPTTDDNWHYSPIHDPLDSACSVMRDHLQRNKSYWWTVFFSVIPKVKCCNVRCSRHASATFEYYQQIILHTQGNPTPVDNTELVSHIKSISRLSTLVISEVPEKNKLWLHSDDATVSSMKEPGTREKIGNITVNDSTTKYAITIKNKGTSVALHLNYQCSAGKPIFNDTDVPPRDNDRVCTLTSMLHRFTAPSSLKHATPCDNSHCGATSTAYFSCISPEGLAPVLTFRISRILFKDKQSVTDETPVILPLGSKNGGAEFLVGTSGYSLQSVIVYDNEHFYAACRTLKSPEWTEHNDRTQKRIPNMSEYLASKQRGVSSAVFVADSVFV